MIKYVIEFSRYFCDDWDFPDLEEKCTFTTLKEALEFLGKQVTDNADRNYLGWYNYKLNIVDTEIL